MNEDDNSNNEEEEEENNNKKGKNKEKRLFSKKFPQIKQKGKILKNQSMLKINKKKLNEESLKKSNHLLQSTLIQSPSKDYLLRHIKIKEFYDKIPNNNSVNKTSEEVYDKIRDLEYKLRAMERLKPKMDEFTKQFGHFFINSNQSRNNQSNIIKLPTIRNKYLYVDQLDSDDDDYELNKRYDFKSNYKKLLKDNKKLDEEICCINDDMMCFKDEVAKRIRKIEKKQVVHFKSMEFILNHPQCVKNYYKREKKNQEIHHKLLNDYYN